MSTPSINEPDVQVEASATETAKETILFNFAYVKSQSQPGSWRRGYAYYQTDQIEALHLTHDGVEAQVKGNYQNAYTTHLIFHPHTVEPHCDCPLEEKWCKHVVAVALKSIATHQWEHFWELPVLEELPSAKLETSHANYRITLNPKYTPKLMGIKIASRRTNKPVTKLEPVLMDAIEAQSESDVKIHPDERREYNLMQQMIKMGYKKTEKPDAFFTIPLNEVGPLIPLIAELDDVVDPRKHPLHFEKDPLKLIMGLNVSTAGNVLVSLHWHRKNPKDVYPLEEVEIFHKEVAWGMVGNRVFPLETTLNLLPKYLLKSSFTDIRDADGGKFMYEELPRLKKWVEIDEADIMEQLSLEQRPPVAVAKLELVDHAALRMRITLSFSYDGVEVPYSKNAPDSPYVMVVKNQEKDGDKKAEKGKKGKPKKQERFMGKLIEPEKGKKKEKKDKDAIYWVRRDHDKELEAYDYLLNQGLDPMQTNNFQAEGDDAIDFYNWCRRGEAQGWEPRYNENDLSILRASDDPLKIVANIEFSQSVDAFILSISCVVGDREMDLDDVQTHLMQGKKYFYMDGPGFVEIPLTDILQFQRILQAFDAEALGEDNYQIQTFKVGLIAELQDMGMKIKMSKKFKKFWNVVSASTDMEEVEVPESVNAELRQYQVRGYNWLWFMYSYGLNGILADDMGLGKTLQALTLLQKAADQDGHKPSLVVCPTSIVFNWLNEIQRFTPELKAVNLTGGNRHGVYKKIKDADIVVTSYSIMRRDLRALKNYAFRYVILDESQYIKNPEAQTARAAKKLQCQHRLALSGTPIENRLAELWSVFDFLMPTFLYDLEEFKYRYITPIEERDNREAERRLKKQVFPFILRRMKQDVMKDLPPKIENIQYCNLTDEQQDLYLKVLEEMRDDILSNAADQGVDSAKGSIFTLLLRLRQICCHPKLLGGDLEHLADGVTDSGKFEALKDMLQDIIANGHRVLLFSQFVEMLNIVKKWLEVEGIPYEYLTGQTKHRQEAVDRFNNNPNIPIFLISLKAGGTGLNLTGADYVIHYDPWWNPMAEDQATDRAHRIGQTKTVFVYRLITKGTVEEKIMRLQGRKRSLVDSIIRADRSMGKFLSFEDLKEILSPDF